MAVRSRCIAAPSSGLEGLGPWRVSEVGQYIAPTVAAGGVVAGPFRLRHGRMAPLERGARCGGRFIKQQCGQLGDVVFSQASAACVGQELLGVVLISGQICRISAPPDCRHPVSEGAPRISEGLATSSTMLLGSAAHGAATTTVHPQGSLLQYPLW
jgi:hypothetical protein